MSIDERLERIERLLVMNSSKEVLNTCEVAIMLNLKEQSVRNMMHNKTIPYYKHGGKAYFKKSEIEAWMLRDRIDTKEEIKSQATTYIVTKRMLNKSNSTQK